MWKRPGVESETVHEPLSRVYAAIIDSQVDRLLAEQRPDGVFQPAGDHYHIYDQYVAYPLALAYLDEDGRYFGDDRVLEAVCRSGDLHAREVGEDGKWPQITRGGNWGSSLDEWRTHFWQETLLLLEDRLDAGRRERWEAGLRRAADGAAAFVRRLDEEGKIGFREGVAEGMSPNHLAWYMLATRRAGLRYGEEAWVERADRLFADMAAGQHADGFWLEYGAPAVMYNFVSLLAIGIYLEHLGPSAPPEIVEAAERGMDAQLRWTYPGGGLVSEIDGRNRYRRGGQLILPAVCARWPRGAAALRASADYLASSDKVGGQALAFFSETARYLDTHEQPDETPADLGPSWRGRDITAGWRRKGPWQVTLSGVMRGPYSGRFLTDLANLVGVFHRDLGLAAGGGSNKDDPDWATFTVHPAGAGEPLYQPEETELQMDESEDRLVLCYGQVRAAVGVKLTADRADVRFELLAGDADVTARLMRPLPPGATATGPDGKSTLDIGRPVHLRFPEGGVVCLDSMRYILPPGATFVWPRMPFNPYNREGTPGDREAFAAFEVQLDVGRPSACISISAG